MFTQLETEDNGSTDRTVFSWGVKSFGRHIECVGRGFWILIKKQITEPIRKLQDESNDTN